MKHTKEFSARKKEVRICMVIGCKTKVTNSKVCKIHDWSNKAISNSGNRKNSKYPAKRTELQKWTSKLDSVFSVFIRLRDTDQNGIGRCISSGKMIHYFISEKGAIRSSCDNGHFHSRRIMSTRWDEFNCHAQDKHENRFKEGMKQDYERGIIKKEGKRALNQLNARSKQSKKYTALDLESLYSYYEGRVKEMLLEKVWWNNQRSIKSIYK